MKKSQVLHYSLEEKLAIVPKSELYLEDIVIKSSKENKINFKTVLFYSSLGWQQTWAFRKAPEKTLNATKGRFFSAHHRLTLIVGSSVYFCLELF